MNIVPLDENKSALSTPASPKLIDHQSLTDLEVRVDQIYKETGDNYPRPVLDELPRNLKPLILRKLDFFSIRNLSAASRFWRNYIINYICQHIELSPKSQPFFKKVYDHVSNLYDGVKRQLDFKFECFFPDEAGRFGLNDEEKQLIARLPEFDEWIKSPLFEFVHVLAELEKAIEVLPCWKNLERDISGKTSIPSTGPDIADLATISGIIRRTEEFEHWFRLNLKLLEAKDKLVTWNSLASAEIDPYDTEEFFEEEVAEHSSYSREDSSEQSKERRLNLEAPQFSRLNTPEQAMTQASRFGAWVKQNRETLDQLTVIKLQYQKLATVPPEICELTMLEKLKLNNNYLSQLPPALSTLVDLGRLHLENNRLTSLPVAIGSLHFLRKIKLQWNQLSFLPDAIGELQCLEELDLTANLLRSLPEGISRLQSLRYLWLDYNKLARLPDSIAQLKNLEKLMLHKNHLKTLPANFDKLTKT